MVIDFPFSNEAHTASWLAGLLTPPARFAFEGPSPVFVIEGNRPGVGKGKLADTISAILTGQQMPSTTMPSKDEEVRKRITSIALAGEPMVLLDNVVGWLGSPSLDAAWTKTYWEDRILGRSEKVRLHLGRLLRG